MNWLTADQQTTIMRISRGQPDRESCGFVLADGTVREVQNAAEDPSVAFLIPHAITAEVEAQGGYRGIWHSHLASPEFSPQDQATIVATGDRWAVYDIASDRFVEADPTEAAPFVGRPFVYGLYDCYSLASDYCQSIGRTGLPPWPRGAYGEWMAEDFRPFDEELPKYGELIDKDAPRLEGDVLMVSVLGHHSDHVGVWLGRNRWLHHPAEGKSCIATWGSHWQNRLRGVVRVHP